MGRAAIKDAIEAGVSRTASRQPFEIAEIKLLRPRTRPGIVPWTPLLQRMVDSEWASLVAIVAPAGFGKTTLLSEWDERDPRPFAWISVDEADTDPVGLLAHIAESIDRVEELDTGVFEAIRSPGASNPGRVLRRLGGALFGSSRPFVLVLDDLDRSPEARCIDAAASLIRSVPAGSQIAIAARTAPEIGLPRLRAEGGVLEIGSGDLALSATQSQKLLRNMGVRVTRPQAEEISAATEGWPVGVYLAGLSHQEQRRSGRRPVRFTGSDRLVVDYVSSEVLGRVSRERQRFLTRTSILERLSGPLCDALLRRTGSARTLASIERRNPLLVPLDRGREWYRYHQLFRDVLRSELTRREPELVPELHRRAADWFEDLGMLDLAIEHALGCGDLDRAANLMQRQMITGYRLGRIATLRAWLDRIGDEVAGRNTGLAITGAWVFALGGLPALAERWLDVAEQGSLSGSSLHGTASLRSSLAIVRAIMMRNGPDAMEHEALIALREEPRTSPFRSAALTLLGIAVLLRGDPEAADAILADSAEIGEAMSALPAGTAALAERSLVATDRGETDRARHLVERALHLVRQGDLGEHVTTGPVHAAAARVALRAGDEERAQQHLAEGHRLRSVLTYGFPSIAVQTRLELARVHVGLSDVAGARNLLAEIDEILRHRPDLGTLSTQVREFRAHIGTLRSARAPGPSTLTEAELRVLNLLPTYLSFREIGARLFVSPNTVKSQAISIYRKLGASARSEAVQTAREAGLLEA